MDTNSRVSVLIADDHPLVRDGLTRMINDQPDMLVVGEACNSDEATAEARRLAPTIMLLDVSMPGAGGVAVAETLATACPEVKVIAVTRHSDPVFLTKMLHAGAAGYVLKQSLTTELLCAIRAVAGGAQYIDASLREPHATVGAKAPAPSAPPPRESLSRVEEQVVQLVARAHSNQEIAQQMSLDVVDVVNIKATAMRKAGLKTRVDAVAYAEERGWT